MLLVLFLGVVKAKLSTLIQRSVGSFSPATPPPPTMLLLYTLAVAAAPPVCDDNDDADDAAALPVDAAFDPVEEAAMLEEVAEGNANGLLTLLAPEGVCAPFCA